MSRVEFRGNCAILWLGSAENKFTTESVYRIKSQISEILRHNQVKVLITASSGKFYSNGIDLDWLGQQQAETSESFFNNLIDLIVMILTLPVFTIAAINGHAFAAGAILALAHDFRVMQKGRGWISLPEVFLGLNFTPGLQEMMKSKIGSPSCLRDAILLGKRFTAEEALDKQLVDRACEPGCAVETSVQLGEEIVNGRDYGREIIKSLKEDLYANSLRLFREYNLSRSVAVSKL